MISKLKIFVLLTILALASVHGAAQQDQLFELEEQQLRLAAKRAANSVVRIETFAGIERAGRILTPTAPTTGLIVTDDGYIVSSAFNFVSQPESILVTLPDQKRVAAKIVARDHSRKIVLLKVDVDSPLTVPTSVPREELQVGQWTVAIGRTFDAENVSVSVGILSAVNRVWGRAIQCDAKISPSNYGGPLVDIEGRILGVLVPLSPQAQSEVAGAEWYDSGIGFAIPLNEILAKLDKLKEGQDLHQGVMGVSLKGSDFSPAEVSVSQPRSPAYDAGVRAGDIIVKANHVAIERQGQLKHLLGPLYAGEVVHLLVKRGDDEIEFDVQLVDKLLPYEHPFLGILPMRNDKQGVQVRYVYTEGPSNRAGIRKDDIVQRFADVEIESSDQLRELISGYQVGEEVSVSIKRADALENVTVKLGSISSDAIAKVPAAYEELETFEGERPDTGLVEIKLPEEEANSFAYVPEQYDPRISYGLVVWLHPPGDFKKEDFTSAWQNDAAENNLIILSPQSKDDKRWMPTEVDFIRKTIDNINNTYSVDKNRIAICGYQAGGSMAFMTAAAHREVIRAVVAVDAPYPITLRPPANDPINRLALFLAWADESKQKRRIESFLKTAKELKFPVLEKKLGKAPRMLSAAEQSELARWIDSLDRI